MKTFNVAASQIWMPNIPMPAIPAGSYYGRVKIDYSVKIQEGIDFIYDKNGHTVYNKNGTPKMKTVYKSLKMCHVMTYIITGVKLSFPVSFLSIMKINKEFINCTANSNSFSISSGVLTSSIFLI